MEITPEQYEKIKGSLPIQRGNVRLSNLQGLNPILYLAEQRCKWRGLPKRYGNWHIIFVRMNRWAKSGALDPVFEKLQLEQIVRIKIEAFSLDSTSVKVHPDGTGPSKNRLTSHREVPRRMEYQDSFGWTPWLRQPNKTLFAVRRPAAPGFHEVNGLFENASKPAGE